MRSRTLIFAFLLLLLVAPAAHAKSYSADRFDARIRVLHGGAVEVTETVVFRFDGTFREVFRKIPRRRTDGIEVLRVSMDGTVFTRGDGPGRYDLSSNNGLRVRWHFGPVTNSTHTFELTYVARGVVQQSDAGDVLRWQALPSDHNYRIASSTVEVDLPVAPVSVPSVNTRRTATARVVREDTHLVVHAEGIRSNGWIEVSAVMPRGSAIEAPPAWQARAEHAAALAPKWLIAAGTILGVGLILLFALRMGYESPGREESVGSTGPDLPDNLPPALAGALVSNGRTGLEQAMATLFALAGQGELSIVEQPRSWGQRSYRLKHTNTGRRLREHEQAVIDAVFTGKGPEAETDLAKARGRVARRMRTFTQAVDQQMIAEGLVDDGRATVRRRYARVATGALILGAVALIPCGIVVRDYGPWVLVVPGAIMIFGILALIMYAALTPLSNEGIRRARGWRGFKKFVHQVTRDRATIANDAATRLLPFAVAMGMAVGWASYLKKHRQGVPDWFRALADDPSGVAFAYFVGSGGSGAGSGGAGGSSAAGGGASGAH